MLHLSTILAWTALATVVSLTPGPDVLLTAAHASRNGFKAGLAAAAGVTTAGLWYIALCGFGFLSILSYTPILFTIVKIAGAIYLAWLGFRLISSALRPAAPADVQAPRLGAPFRQGFLSCFLNPKVAIFYLAVLPQFVHPGPEAPLYGSLLIAIHFFINIPWLSFVAFAASRAGNALRSSTFVRWAEGLLGIAFVGFAGRLAIARSS